MSQFFSILNASTSIGYGPSNKLNFDGDATKYELWEVKFLSYLRLQKLISIIDSDDTAVADYAEKNANIFALITQFFDDTSLSLVIRDAKNDGKLAIMWIAVNPELFL